MKLMSRKKRPVSRRGILITLLAFCVLALVMLVVIDLTGSRVTDEQAQLLRDNLYSAAVNGYAVEGRYPTLEEIKTRYGVVVDDERYDVYYSSFGSNIMPAINVRIHEGQAK